MSVATKSHKSIAKYLARYAEAEVHAIQDLPHWSWQYVVLLPAYKESSEFLERFLEGFSGVRVLLILIINQPESDEQPAPQLTLFRDVLNAGKLVWQKQNLTLVNGLSSQASILVVDRFSSGQRIPIKQGVGLARKIGADLACWLIHNQFVTQPQIYSTDADASLPGDYFSHSQLSQDAAAGVFAFQHIADGDPAVTKATGLYEQRLRYYVDGLAFAKSPYAFHTIGSCLTFTMSAYCQVRGFPKKSGGEDFYLLNKLAKIGDVAQLTPCIRIKARLSDRVPFGTGPAVADIVAQQLHEDTYLVYHPKIFVGLKNLLIALHQLCLHEIDIVRFSQKLDANSKAFLTQSGFFQQFDKWQKQYKDQGLLLTVNHWFDAFRTLKYVHFQRDNGLADVSLLSAKLMTHSLWQ